jgi:hypothetical protein
MLTMPQLMMNLLSLSLLLLMLLLLLLLLLILLSFSPLHVWMNDMADPYPHLLEEHVRRREEARAVGPDDDYYDNSSDSDDETNLVDHGRVPMDPGGASFLMEEVVEKHPRYRIREMTVNFTASVSDAIRRRNTGRGGDDDNDEYAIRFGKFVNVLDMYFRIRTLHLTRANFWRGPGALLENHDGRNVPTNGFDPTLLLRDESMARFFGEVLPKHLSLRDVTISKSRIQAEYWRLFAENCITSKGTLERLALESTPITPEGCQHLKRMLQREVPLFQLKLQDCELGADEWRGVCEGISGNPEMHTLR